MCEHFDESHGDEHYQQCLRRNRTVNARDVERMILSLNRAREMGLSPTDVALLVEGFLELLRLIDGEEL